MVQAFSRSVVNMMIAQPVWLGCRFTFVTALMLVMLGCGGQPIETRTAHGEQRRPVAGEAQQSDEQRVVAVALDQIGVPYRYGGNDRSGFDCSGLVQYSYARAGIGVPRTTGQLWNAAQPVEKHRLQPGDLLFFDIEGKMSHVGLYVGDGHFVHAPSSGRSVSVGNLRSGYYAKALIRGGRIE